MAGMNAEQLKSFMETNTLPMVKDLVGKEVAEVVKAAVAAALANQPNYAARMFDDPAAQAKGGKVRDKGLDVGAYVRCLAAARNDKEKAVHVAKMWGYKDVAAALEKSIAKAMSEGDPTAGGFLVPQEFSSDVIELLRAAGVVRSLDPLVVPMSSGTLKIPRITTGTSASYIGENTNIGKTQLATGQLTLTFKKLAALVPISNDLLRYSAPSADGIVRDDLVRAISAREDQAFIRDDGTSGTPRGLKYQIDSGNKFNANGTVSLANVTIDLGKAMRFIMDANISLIIQQGTASPSVDVRPGWIFAPRTWQYLTTLLTANGNYAFRDEMMRGTLWGFPYRVTSQVQTTLGTTGAQSEVYFGCFAHAVIGEAQGLIIDASQEAAYHDGTNVVAAFSQDQTVIRVIAEHDFAVRHSRAFSLIEQVTWGA
jgi:HK97 family phage major capsid protein